MVTSFSNFPEEIRKYWDCKLLHKKTAIWNGEYVKFGDKEYKKIDWVCKECNGKRK